MVCRLCGGKCKERFSSKILNKYNIKYYLCDDCKLLQTEKPFWLKEAYSKVITDSDTGLVSRNLLLVNKVSLLLSFLFGNKGSYLDYGAGYGLFVRLMKDKKFNFYWYDQFADNIFAKDLEYVKGNKIDAVTAFELFEHFDNPRKEIEKILKISKTIIFSTRLVNLNKDTPENWWYFATEHGQHIAFYSIETLEFIAKKYGLKLYSNGSTFHVLTDRKLNKYSFRIIIFLSKFSSLVDFFNKIFVILS